MENQDNKEKSFEDIINDLNSLLEKIPKDLSSNEFAAMSETEKKEKNVDFDDDSVSKSNENIVSLEIDEINKADISNVLENTIKDSNLEDLDVDGIEPFTHKEDEITDNNLEKSDENIFNIENIEIENLSIDETVESEIKIQGDTKDVNSMPLFSVELKNLLDMKKPEGVSDDRLKGMGIVYGGDEELLINFLRYLDEICLMSETKKMFVERRFILSYDENFTTDMLSVRCREDNVNAVVIVGNIEMAKLYEIESVLSSIGCVFLHLKRGDFSKSMVIDFVLNLIAL